MAKQRDPNHPKKPHIEQRQNARGKQNKVQKSHSTASHTAELARQIWFKTRRQDRRWLHHRNQKPNRDGLNNRIQQQLLHLMSTKDQHELDELLAPNTLDTATVREWRRLMRQRAAALAAQGGGDFVEDWWGSGDLGIEENEEGGVALLSGLGVLPLRLKDGDGQLEAGEGAAVDNREGGVGQTGAKGADLMGDGEAMDED